MKITRAAAVPLITHDPYFSIWSGSDHLYDADPIHWSGLPQQLRGAVTAGGKEYAFMGDPQGKAVIEQQEINLSAYTTEYVFASDDLKLSVSFTSPVIASDPVLLSRPVTYVDILCDTDLPDPPKVTMTLGRNIVCTDSSELSGLSADTGHFRYAMMGTAMQKPLGYSGDNHTINYGYAYLASRDEDAVFTFCQEEGCIRFEESAAEMHLVIAYDDLVSINYFGNFCRAYWTSRYSSILEAIGAAMDERESVQWQCASLSQKLQEQAEQSGGEDYAFLCLMSVRHVMAAHKLIRDENGDLIFLSKENDSNGCIGTVDVSYPSVPLLLLQNPELVKGLIRPVMRFASCPVWEYDFAPHDVGRYPYAWGQVYGMNGKTESGSFSGAPGAVYPPFYMYPAGTGIYNERYQMPVEESGNIMIMTAAVCLAENNGDFAKPYLDQFSRWYRYLEKYGADPAEQLCTDDFAGHLAHNVNLAIKAVMGMEAYSIVLKMNGRSQEASAVHEKASSMAKSIESRSNAGNHYSLVFSETASHASEDETVKDTWSLKYNLVWDKIFGSHLFPEEMAHKEIDCYLEKLQPYGVPLDSRKLYTKSDWELWCAAMTDDLQKRQAIIAPIARYLRETPSRYPFSDWYQTDTGEYCHFKARSVQGGIFMPLLADQK